MKKFIFSIFAICLYAPSFGACNHIPSTQAHTESQYLESRFSFDDKFAYLQCGGTANNDAQCAESDIVVGKDGFLYKCSSSKWTLVEDINNCNGTRYQNAGLYPTSMQKNSVTDYIYLVQYVSGSERTSYRCKFAKKDDSAVKERCIITCGEYLGGICNRDHAKDITIDIVDESNNKINNATITYSNMSNENGSENIAKFSDHSYSICLNDSNKTLNIQISAQGYLQKTIMVENLLKNKKITLQKKQSSASPAATNKQDFITPNEEHPTITNTDSEENCKNTNGDGLDENGKCICDPDEHLVEYKYEGEYSICRCMDGYHRVGEPDENGKYAATGECVYAPETKIDIVPDKIGMQRDAEDAYRNEYDNAQSWANKGTTALSTLATGEGAMMAARAIAEKIADDDAEEKMSEYITTMKCEYGGGQQVDLGDTETLPGGNELAKYYAEYKQLADKLKVTKTALNLRPGIEAEVLYDRAETGLYQYQNAERQNGGFTSLSRALMNPEGADATAWNAQRTETNQNLLVGGALATVGLAGSYIANRAINKDHVKKYKELEEKFMEITTKLEREYPEIFTAPTPQQPIQEESVGTLDPVIPSIEPLPANEPDAIDLSNLTDQAFKRSEINLTPEGADALKTEAKYLDDQLKEHPNMNITITATGHADPDGISAKTATALTNRYKEIFNVNSLPNKYKNKKIGKNDDLALARAEVALKFLTEKLSEDTKKRVSTIAQTRGDRDCPKGTPKEKYDTCRYVGFEVQINITGAQ